MRWLISLSFSRSIELAAMEDAALVVDATVDMAVDALIDDVARSNGLVRLIDAPAFWSRTLAGVLDRLVKVDRPFDNALDTELEMALDKRLDAVLLPVAVLPIAALDSVMRSESALDKLPGRLARPLKSTFSGLPLISGRSLMVLVRSGKWIVLLGLFLKKLL